MQGQIAFGFLPVKDKLLIFDFLRSYFLKTQYCRTYIDELYADFHDVNARIKELKKSLTQMRPKHKGKTPSK